MQIFYTEDFVSQFERLPKKTQAQALKKIALFENDLKHPSLKTHKLHGVLDGYSSFTVDLSIRIVFKHGDGEKSAVYFLKIGTHEVYR